MNTLLHEPIVLTLYWRETIYSYKILSILNANFCDFFYLIWYLVFFFYFEGLFVVLTVGENVEISDIKKIWKAHDLKREGPLAHGKPNCKVGNWRRPRVSL